METLVLILFIASCVSLAAFICFGAMMLKILWRCHWTIQAIPWTGFILAALMAGYVQYVAYSLPGHHGLHALLLSISILAEVTCSFLFSRARKEFRG